MRNVRLRRAATLLPLIIMGGCADLPTSPFPEGTDAGPLLSGECTKQSNGSYLCPPIFSDPVEPGDPCEEMESTPGGGDVESTSMQSCPPGDGGGGISPPPDHGSPGGDEPIGGGGDPSAPPGQGAPPPLETEVVDTCKTGEPVVDATKVWGGFQELWLESTSNGVETGGWVVSDGSTFRLVPFQSATASGACTLVINESPPAGTVAMVHTHPWPLWSVNPCGYLYTGTPSDEDVSALQQLGLSTGYFLDAAGIGKYTATGGETSQRIGRCGY
jgi:hypothetical protein